jgi:hypothetical protein
MGPGRYLMLNNPTVDVVDGDLITSSLEKMLKLSAAKPIA